MADNFTANPGSGGTVFASDEVTIAATTVHVPRVKLGFGVEGSYVADVSDAQPLPVRLIAYPDDGLSIFRSLDLDETEEEVKNNPATLHGVWFSNLSTSTRFLKFYDANASGTVVGTTVPKITIALPGNSTDDVSGSLPMTMGIDFGSALTVACTTGAADADTGAPGAGEVIVNIFYR